MFLNHVRFQLNPTLYIHHGMSHYNLMSSGREFQSVNALLNDLSSPQFVFDLTDLIVSLERVSWL